jgi:hypothetical protein
MSSRSLTLWAVIGLISGLALLGYILLAVPPASREGGIDTPVLLLLLIGCLLATSCLGIIVALQIHRRTTRQTGRRQGARNRKQPQADAALRQGFIFGITCTLLIGLAIVHLLDIVIALVVVLLAGFVEAFAQARSRRQVKQTHKG